MKVTYIEEPALIEAPAPIQQPVSLEEPALIEAPESTMPEPEVEPEAPAPALIEEPKAESESTTPEEQAAQADQEQVALKGTRSLILDLQSRLETINTEIAEHRKATQESYGGDPLGLAAHLAEIENHMGAIAALRSQAESLNRQLPIAQSMLERLEQDRAQRIAAEKQAAGTQWLMAARERWLSATAQLVDALIELGAAARAADRFMGFGSGARFFMLPDWVALGMESPNLPGLIHTRGGFIISKSDPVYQAREAQWLSQL